MSRALVALVAAVVVLSGCSGDDGKADVLTYDGGPPASSVEVDTPELRDLKAEAGIEDCAPGPGGGALPAVRVACLGGGPAVDLSSLRGPMVINIWQSACTACEKEMPILQAFHETYGDRVPVLGIDSTDVFPGTALEQLRDRGVTYPQLADPGGDLQDTDTFARVRGYPYLAFVDETGEITYEKFGAVESGDELHGLVEEHLGVSL
ncbi:TlpA disulfide reductase family protein [Nocardioides sp.]|uniref:TlpA family protein disulfide reductase n=1 Tax=Nocardioides sp. TaxID=35761 RepID=UPI001A2FEF4D|nr:TlpA disulfide reductase family protein [Nocardioides sp.]MBJ7356511.1 TlpA family protein disulfide reductase [Nocardioides sp.]